MPQPAIPALPFEHREKRVITARPAEVVYGLGGIEAGAVGLFANHGFGFGCAHVRRTEPAVLRQLVSGQALIQPL